MRLDSTEATRLTPLRRRAMWVAGAVALVLIACGSFLLNRSADTPEAAAEAVKHSDPVKPEFPDIETKTRAVEIPALAASAAEPSPVARIGDPDELRKVQLALEGRATPKQKLEAAAIISACKNADTLVQTVYALRDQHDRQWQILEKSSGISSEEKIKMLQGYQRSCQAFDASTLARSGELLKGAYEGGAKDAAMPYLLWLLGSGQKVDPDLRGKLQREARQTVEDGDLTWIMHFSLSFDPAALGTTEVQRQAYKEAWFLTQREMGGVEMENASRASIENTEKLMAQAGALPPPLTSAQQREANELTVKVIDAWRKRQRKGRPD